MNPQNVDTVNKKAARLAPEVFEAVHTVMHLFRAEQYRFLRDGAHPIAHMEGKTLGYVARHPDCTLKALVAHFSRDKGQLARVIKTLKEQGLLTAEPDPRDRRSAHLRLTDEGRKIHQALQRQATRLSTQAVKGLSAAECAHLVGLLGRVRANLETPEG